MSDYDAIYDGFIKGLVPLSKLDGLDLSWDHSTTNNVIKDAAESYPDQPLETKKIILGRLADIFSNYDKFGHLTKEAFKAFNHIRDMADDFMLQQSVMNALCKELRKPVKDVDSELSYRHMLIQTIGTIAAEVTDLRPMVLNTALDALRRNLNTDIQCYGVRTAACMEHILARRSKADYSLTSDQNKTILGILEQIYCYQLQAAYPNGLPNPDRAGLVDLRTKLAAVHERIAMMDKVHSFTVRDVIKSAPKTTGNVSNSLKLKV